MPTTRSLVDTKTLQKLTTIGQLSPEAFHDLRDKAALTRLPAGTKLFSADDVDDWTLYLVDGIVDLVSKDATAVETVFGGSTKSEMPLAPQLPRRVTAKANTEVEVIRVRSSLLEVLLHPPRSDNYELEEIQPEDPEVENQLLYEVFEDFVADKLDVPTLPDVALRIRKVVDDPDVQLGDVVSIVTADPAIAARLVQVANSAAYGGRSTVSDCRDAIVRLGLNTTKELVSSIALKGLFRASSPLLKQRMLELWRHSTLVAAISTLLSKRTGRFNPDRVLLAGLVHDIGALAIINRAAHYPNLLSDSHRLDIAIAKLRGQVGAMILRKWEFTEDLVTTALEVEDWERDPAPEPDCCDVVLIAQVLSFIGTSKLLAVPPFPKLPAFRKLAIDGMSPEECLSVIDEAGDAVAELHACLEG